MGADRLSPHHPDSELAGKIRRLDIQVIENFQMIRNEPKRRHENVPRG